MSGYSEMLKKLSICTAIVTFIFLSVLVKLDHLPLIDLKEGAIPSFEIGGIPSELIISFGTIPLLGAVFAWIVSKIFEVYNKVSILFGLRDYWERSYIIKPMLQKVDLDCRLDNDDVKCFMKKLYYPEVNKIDQHYVKVFWNYALYFWILFEHSLAVLVTNVVIVIFFNDRYSLLLLVYAVLVVFLTFVQWRFVVVGKSKAQALEIPNKAIITFMHNKE